MAARDDLQHIVVVMMSGRSFDHMLGGLKARDSRIDGLTGAESNPDATGGRITVEPLAEYQGQLDPSPSQTFRDVAVQLGLETKAGAGSATMGGFVRNYFDQRRDGRQARAVMYYFAPEKLPVLTTLATEFAVFTRWFSSVPGPSIPNHAFAHFGTSFGAIGGTRSVLSPKDSSVFDRLVEAGATAKLYFDAAGGSFGPVGSDRPAIAGSHEQFFADCRSGSLPNYAFVEPNHADHRAESRVVLASDQLADHHVLEGERFIAAIYSAIRSNASLWRTTALLIVYDQHGGLYDHVPPPECPPDSFVADGNATGTGSPFPFDRLGVRVPAVLVSPFVPKGTVIDRVFDHASISATVTRTFVPDFGGYTVREKTADRFLDVLSLATARGDAPTFDVELAASAGARRRKGAARSTAASGVEASADAVGDVDVPAKLSIAGFQSDVAAGDDLLGIAGDVERLCAVLAAKDVEPPVSIGLFGDWGSGKTFFMQQMQKQFDRIKAETRKAPHSSAFCGEIVQLWFNAWHYIDHNIWASLASEIFDKLGEAVALDAAGEVRKDAADYKRAQLTARAAAAKQELDKSMRDLAGMEATVRGNDQRLAQLETNVRRAADAPRFLQTLVSGAVAFGAQEADADARVKEVQRDLDRKLADAAVTLGMAPADAQSEAIKRQLLDLKGTAGHLRALIFSVRHSEHRGAWAAYLAAAVLAIVAVPWLATRAMRIDMQLARGIVGGLSLAAPLWKFLPRLNRALAAIARARDESAAKIRSAYDAEMQALREQQREARQAADDLRARTESQRKTVESLETDLDRLRPDRQLADFIQQRRTSGDYKQHLGVIAKAYADFEQLTALLTKAREELDRPRDPNGGPPERQLLPRIDRIVLYIDDLDRCPEDKVFDVLQAIHLLLFFPLFVVVVGVDSRWLLHSLGQQAHVLRAAATARATGDPDAWHWESTPLNYLEKIFQIAYAVPPMGSSGYKQLMDSLTAPKSRPTPPPPDAPKPATPEPGPTQRADQATRPAAAERVRDANEPTPSAVARAAATSTVDVESLTALPQPALDLNPEYLRLQPGEREFLKRLHPLIPSPRAAKRFVNLYRLLRTTVGDKERSAFVTDTQDGEYRAVQLFLAIQTGYPEQAVAIVRDLVEKQPHGNWWEFIERYSTRYLPAAHQSTPAEDVDRDVVRWREFLERVTRIRPGTETLSSQDFVKWAPRVARYSFQSARAVQTASRPGEHV